MGEYEVGVVNVVRVSEEIGTVRALISLQQTPSYSIKTALQAQLDIQVGPNLAQLWRGSAN